MCRAGRGGGIMRVRSSMGGGGGEGEVVVVRIQNEPAYAGPHVTTSRVVFDVFPFHRSAARGHPPVDTPMSVSLGAHHTDRV